MKTYEVMNQNYVTINKNEKVIDAASKMKENDTSFLIVVENEEPIGSLSYKEIVELVSKGYSYDIPIYKIMKKYIVSVNENENLDDACDMMGYMQIKELIIVDDNNKIKGVLSLYDLARNTLTEEYALNVLTENSYDYSTEDDSQINIETKAFFI